MGARLRAQPVNSHGRGWAARHERKRLEPRRNGVAGEDMLGNAADWQLVEYAANMAWTVHGVTEVVDHLQLTTAI